MNFLAPWNLLWLLPIGGLIVLMYILKLRRKDVVVSSTLLWRQVIRDTQANAPFQKLRKNLLLCLQLFTASLLVLALARPFLRLTGFGGRRIVLIVDTSASMGATDVKPSRLEVAKKIARERIDALQPGDQMMILSAYSRPEAVTGFTAKREELRHAVGRLQLHDTPNQMREALNLAANLVAARDQNAAGRIELISDGSFEEGGQALDLGQAQLEFFPVGVGRHNVGITAVDFRRNLGEENSVQVLIVTRNFSDKPLTFTQELHAEENLVDAQEITLPPGGENTEPIDLPEPERPVTLRVRLDVEDDLGADNTALLILTPRKRVRALLVGRESLFLEKALQVDPGVEVSKAAVYTGQTGYDVVIFNEEAPAKLPPGRYLFFHCASDQAPVRVEGEAANVAPADWDREHPALRYVDFGSERFGKALNASPRPWGREIAVAESGALIVAGENERTRALFVGFSLSESLFALRVAFPIFVSNSVRWLATGDANETTPTATGKPALIPAPPGTGRLIITRPDGVRREIVAGERGGTAFDETDRIGVYTVMGRDFAYRFAVNLGSAAESDITPRRELTIGGNPAPVSGKRVTVSKELLPWLIALALIVLAVEWWAFHRRVYVN
jgi:hypothetical protein